MSGKTRLFEFRDSHSDIGLDVLRIYLGIALFARGVLFVMGGSSSVLELVRAEGVDYFLPAMALQATIGLHLVGGLMLAFGLLTRVGALIQIPILLGAVYLAVLQGGLLTLEQSLELSVLVLFLLGIFFVYGSGPVSLDRYFHRQPDKSAAERPPAQPYVWEDRYPDEAPPLPSAVPAAAPAESDDEESQRAYAVALAKYAALSLFAVAVVVVGLRNLPPAVSRSEIGAIGALVLVIVGVFLIFYRSAFQED